MEKPVPFVLAHTKAPSGGNRIFIDLSVPFVLAHTMALLADELRKLPKSQAMLERPLASRLVVALSEAVLTLDFNVWMRRDMAFVLEEMSLHAGLQVAQNGAAETATAGGQS